MGVGAGLCMCDVVKKFTFAISSPDEFLLSCIEEYFSLLLNKQVSEYCTEQKEPAVNGILVQQHFGGSAFFNRSWEEFKVGFGNTSGNYWIGNERLHQLTNGRQYKLRVDLLSRFTGRWYWAEYGGFSVADELSDYTLFVSDYSGNAGDGMTVDGVTDYNLNGVKFNTYDRHTITFRCISASNENVVGGFWYALGGLWNCGQALVNRQSPNFAWKSLPLGTRSANQVALLKSRMTLLQK